MPLSDKETKIREIVYQIPPGSVMTYGDISAVIYGNRRHGQDVASAIKAGTKQDSNFPWWRVVGYNLLPTKTPPLEPGAA